MAPLRRRIGPRGRERSEIRSWERGRPEERREGSKEGDGRLRFEAELSRLVLRNCFSLGEWLVDASAVCASRILAGVVFIIQRLIVLTAE